MSGTILIVEDEPDLQRTLEYTLQREGYQTRTASNGKAALEHLSADPPPDLVLLDLMLPGMQGLDVLRELRQAGQATPVIIVSARGQDRDKVTGLELGADDYITKPFGLEELSARIRAVLRRSQGKQAVMGKVLRFKGLTIDFTRFTAVRDGVEHQLSRYESEILRMLIEHRGEVVSRQDLLRHVWGYVHLPTTRTVDNHIARLRKKLEKDVDNPEHVVTVHGLGYRFDSVPL